MNNKENNLNPKCFNLTFIKLILWYYRDSILLLIAHQAKSPILYRVLIKLIPSLEFQDSNNTVPINLIHIKILIEVRSVVASVLMTV